ncbi:hypothetical protein [Nocardia arthritidis]|uniref:hypothetical protein n=1 Tax=Nocardia arthritidis TaxID=228602 RepID=UPI0012EDFA71|nr:hypothetical protein [Nocardia arthritidis]
MVATDAAFLGEVGPGSRRRGGVIPAVDRFADYQSQFRPFALDPALGAGFVHAFGGAQVVQISCEFGDQR